MTVPEEARDLEAIFARAWADARNTRIELPAVDVNRLLKNPLRTQAFWLVRNRGALLKAGLGPVEKGQR